MKRKAHASADAVEYADVVIDAFKIGDYPQGSFGPAELAEVVSTYNPAVYEAPVTIGHVSDYKGQTKIPAFGWIGKAFAVGGHLKLALSEFTDELKELVKKGYYKKVSAAFYKPDDANNPTPGKWHLHHLAFLGAVPPAVKGLEAISFCEMSSPGLAFAEMDAAVAETAATEDTYQAVEESFASCLAKMQDAIASDADSDTKRDRMYLALSDCYNEITSEIGLHFAFLEKVEQITKTEMSEFKTRLKEFADRIFKNNKQKEADAMDAAKEKEFTDKITALETTVKEFADQKKKAEDEAAAAVAKAAEDAAKAADDKLRADVKEFCEKQGLATKKMDELHLQDALFAVAKVQGVLEFGEVKLSPLDLMKGVLAEMKAGVTVPAGETAQFAQQPVVDARPEVVKRAEKYVKAHTDAKEFADCRTDADKINRVISLGAQGKIRF